MFCSQISSNLYETHPAHAAQRTGQFCLVQPGLQKSARAARLGPRTGTALALNPSSLRVSSHSFPGSRRPPVPMAPKVLMVSHHFPRRRRRLGHRGAARARPLMATALTPLSTPYLLLVPTAAGRGEAQHRALHRLRPLRWPRKCSGCPLRRRIRAGFCFWCQIWARR